MKPLLQRLLQLLLMLSAGKAGAKEWLKLLLKAAAPQQSCSAFLSQPWQACFSLAAG